MTTDELIRKCNAFRVFLGKMQEADESQREYHIEHRAAGGRNWEVSNCQTFDVTCDHKVVYHKIEQWVAVRGDISICRFNTRQGAERYIEQCVVRPEECRIVHLMEVEE